MESPIDKPVVAVTLGDPAGIGPELIARLLSRPDTAAQGNVVLVGDRWLWEEGSASRACRSPATRSPRFADVRGRSDTSRAGLPRGGHGASPRRCTAAQAEAAGGASVLAVLDRCLDAARAGTDRRDLLRAAEQVRDEARRTEARGRTAPLRRSSSA